MSTPKTVEGAFSQEEDRALLRLRERRVPVPAIAAGMNRKTKAVEKRVERLGKRGITTVAAYDAADAAGAVRLKSGPATGAVRTAAESAALRDRAVRLHRGGGLTVVQVAERLGITPGAAAGVLHRARKAGHMNGPPPAPEMGVNVPPPSPKPRAAVPAPRAQPLRAAPTARRIVGSRAISPHHPDHEAEKAAWKRAQAHADRVQAAPPLTEAEMRGAIARHLAEKGVTRCPTKGQWDFDTEWERLSRR